MPLRDQSTLRIVLYEGEGAQPLDGSERFAALTSLLERGYSITRASGERAVAPADRTAMLVLGRFAGAVPEFDGRLSTGGRLSGVGAVLGRARAR